MAKSHIEKLVETADGMRLYQQERLILDTTELICEVMEDNGINRTDLAKQLGKSKGFISQLLDGSQNMTLRTLSDVFLALGLAVHVETGPVEATIKSPVAFSVDVDDAVWADQIPWRAEDSCPMMSGPRAGSVLEVDIAA